MPPTSIKEADALEIGIEAYIYAYPLILMELTRRLSSNVVAPTNLAAPINQFAHLPAFPDADFNLVVRPNADTLYSALLFDVREEPLVLNLPDSHGRYFLLPMLDQWTDVFASPGARTSGTGKQSYAITGLGWKGKLPDGVTQLVAPTAHGWILGRTESAGPSDYAEVNAFQRALTAVPLSQLGKAYAPPPGKLNPRISSKPPVEVIESLGIEAYFALFCELTKLNPPHANDYPILARMHRIGLVPGQSFALAKLPAPVAGALKQVAATALAKIKTDFQRAGEAMNGWRVILRSLGTYGTDYLQRSGVAFAGLGANCVEDAIYPTALTDSDGQPFDSGARYQLHFEADQLPPVRAFWSLTMYNQAQLLAKNPIDRYALGDRSPLLYNQDGSLDLYIQRESPGADKEANWLPAPASGPFTMNLRLYWPKPEALDGSWTPSGVDKVS